MTTEKEQAFEETIEQTESTEEVTTAEEVAVDMTALMSEFENRYRRLQADFDNFRKRTQGEKEQLGSYVKGEVIGEILPILDNFERALGVEVKPETEAFLEGFRMIQQQLVAALVAKGLVEIDALGQEFDPNLHQAVLYGPEEGYEENHVCAVLQKGYTVDGRVIRPAMVKVAN